MPWFWSDQYDVKLQIAGLSEGYDQTVRARRPATPAASRSTTSRGGELLAVDAINSMRDFMNGKKWLAERKHPDPRAARRPFRGPEDDLRHRPWPNRHAGAAPRSRPNDVSRHFLATLAQWTGGLSPQAFGGAWLNVLARLATAPGRQAELARAALRKTLALAQFSGAALKGEPPRAAGTPYANRFADPAWAKFPFNLLAQSFLSASDWAREAVQNVPGADPAAENIVGFTVREGLELVAPDNYLPTNPQLIRQTVDENGRNLVRGVKHLAEDVGAHLQGPRPGRRRELRGRQAGGGHARQGDPAQRG